MLLTEKKEIIERKKEYVHLLLFQSEHFARLVLKFGGRNSHLSISPISSGITDLVYSYNKRFCNFSIQILKP